MTFRYADEGGNELTVEPSIIRESCRVIARDPDLDETACVVISRENVPAAASDIVIAMHQAVGLAAPIVIERPLDPVPEMISGLAGCVDVGRTQGAPQPITVAVRGASQPLSTEDAYRLALRLIAQVEAVSATAGPGAVQSLGRLISMYGANEACGQAAARAILSRYHVEERAS